MHFSQCLQGVAAGVVSKNSFYTASTVCTFFQRLFLEKIVQLKLVSWAYSSVGQSSGLIIHWSLVQVQLGPPTTKWTAIFAVHFFIQTTINLLSI